MRGIRYLNTVSVLIRRNLNQRRCEYYGLITRQSEAYRVSLKCDPKAKASAGQVMDPEGNEYVDNALDNGNMARSAIHRNVVAPPCPAVLVTSIHLTTMIRNSR